MASVNKVILVGNLGRDPEIRYLQSGQAVANFTVATNDRWTDRDGKPQERTEWHRIVVWGKQAENCANYLSKGRTVYIEGRLQTREWEDKEGQKRQTTEVVAQTVQFLSPRDPAGRAAPARGAGEPGAAAEEEPRPGPASDDIPF
jgi:single-strand DNA-binding protein